jgi:peptidoglycan/LPS O-acetylase OafA/YrhL
VKTQKTQFPALTGIRFFLALWVVIFHLTLPFRDVTHLPFVAFCFIRTGFLAVGFFFALSGFVLAYNYPLSDLWSRSKVTDFAAARFARIYPTYCVGLLLAAPFVVALHLANSSSAKLEKLAVVAVLNVTVLQSWFPKLALSWNVPGWSLCCEVFFYCCFPFVGVALWKLRRLRSLAIACTVIWVASLIGPLVAVKLPIHGYGDMPATSQFQDAVSGWAYLLKFNPLLRLPEFLLGVVLGKAYDELCRRKSVLLGRGSYLYVPGLILELAMMSQCNAVPSPLFHGGLFLPIHSMVILGLALGGGLPARMLSMRPIVFLGKASYSLYILHMPLFWWMDWIGARILLSPTRDARLSILYLATAVGLSALVFEFFEEPLNRIVRNRLVSLFGATDANRTRLVGVGA